MDENIAIKNICNNIKFLRKITKLSKVKMAKILGISVRSLTTIEKGILPPGLGCGFIVEIHRKFGIELLELTYEWDFEKMSQSIEQ